jgi:L-serine/L-threonine ammonia-lyase
MTHLHIETPVLQHPALDTLLNKDIYFKMECYQPAGSFKIRGIGALCQHHQVSGAERLVSSSGGNAGLAAAYAGRKLGLPVTVVVPSTTSTLAKERIAAEGAEIIIHGSVWDEADAHARRIVEETASGYIHPFNHPVIWEGHATLIDEAAQQIPRPDAVLVAVGGGGLMCGVLQGMHRNGWQDVPLLAAETEGAASFAASVAAGERVELGAITSIAKTLGAKQVAQDAFDWTKKHTIHPVTVSDADTVDACLRLADDLRVITEPACGAALAPVYNQTGYIDDYQSVLVVVCGGSGVTIEQLLTWRSEGM